MRVALWIVPLPKEDRAYRKYDEKPGQLFTHRILVCLAKS